MDNRLRIIIPEQFTANGRLDMKGFIEYLQTENIFEFTYDKEWEVEKGFMNWVKDVINITKQYLK